MPVCDDDLLDAGVELSQSSFQVVDVVRYSRLPGVYKHTSVNTQNLSLNIFLQYLSIEHFYKNTISLMHYQASVLYYKKYLHFGKRSMLSNIKYILDCSKWCRLNWFSRSQYLMLKWGSALNLNKALGSNCQKPRGKQIWQK